MECVEHPNQEDVCLEPELIGFPIFLDLRSHVRCLRPHVYYLGTYFVIQEQL